MASFDAALRDWEKSTGDAASAHRRQFKDRIDRALASPWPSTAQRRQKLQYAASLLRRRDR
jgi:hypothetical protein